MENKFAKKKKEKLEGAGVFVRGRGVSGVECGSAWEWAWVRVGFYFYCHCFVLLFLFLLLFLVFGFFHSFLQNFIKFKMYCSQTSRGPPFYFGGFQVSLTPKK